MVTLAFDAASWQAYTLRLYGEGGPLAAVPQPGEVDLVYDAMLPPALRPHHLPNERCPHRPNEPFVFRSPHSPLVSWFRRRPDAGFKHAPSHTWLEVSHCGGSAYEAQGAWLYATRGSALFVNVGRTRVFRTHADAARRLLKSATAECTKDGDMCSHELAKVRRHARMHMHMHMHTHTQKLKCMCICVCMCLCTHKRRELPQLASAAHAAGIGPSP